MGKVICVTGLKGGVGKTSTAVNLSAAFAAKGMKTLLIDCDPLGSSTIGLGLKKKSVKKTLYSLFAGRVGIEALVRKSGVDNLDIIPSNAKLFMVELKLPNSDAHAYRLRDALTGIRDRYEVIVIDTPPSLNILTINALAASDTYVTPVQCDYLCYESLPPLFGAISYIKERFNPGLELEGLVLTMFDAGENVCGLIADNIRRHFEDRVFRTVIPRSVQMRESPVSGRPIVLEAEHSVGGAGYIHLAEEILARGL